MHMLVLLTHSHSLFCAQSADDSCSQSRRHVLIGPSHLQSGSAVHDAASLIELHARAHDCVDESHRQSPSARHAAAVE